jgi:hypothetical protein
MLKSHGQAMEKQSNMLLTSYNEHTFDGDPHSNVNPANQFQKVSPGPPSKIDPKRTHAEGNAGGNTNNNALKTGSIEDISANSKNGVRREQ